MSTSPRPEIEVARTAGTHRPDQPVLVLLHGRGSNEGDLIQLAPHLGAAPETGSGDAPRGDGLTIVSPRAPWPGAPWGYGPGWAWYRYLGEDRPDAETFRATLEAMDTFVDGLEARLGAPVGPLVVGGFSQGGTVSLAWGLRNPERVAGVVNLSGFLADAPPVHDALGSAGGLQVFWGHGEADPAIPFELGRRGRDRLREHGAVVEAFDHGGGHTITPAEVGALRDWIRDRTSG